MKKMHLYVLVGLLILMMSWEYQQTISASVVSGNPSIPEESLRLRVLAHNDHPVEQLLKREVRDAIVAQMGLWAEELNSMEEARQKLQSSLPQLEEIVEETVKRSGLNHSFTIKYGQIPFPTKLYGSQLYPAGEYEGLLITIGAGQGENWWCVLFPPLCFVDFGMTDEKEANQGNEELQVKDQEEQMDQEKQMGQDEQKNQEDQVTDQEGNQVEVRFFLAELALKIKALFA